MGSTQHHREAAGPAARKPGRLVRIAYALATLTALAVTLVFATAGDGVDVAEAEGVRRVVVEFGHTLVWVLLTIAFAVAATRSRWTGASKTFAAAAGILYALFLIAVFLWP